MCRDGIEESTRRATNGSRVLEASVSSRSGMLREVYIYNDWGASEESVKGWIFALRHLLRYPASMIHLLKACNVSGALRAQKPIDTAFILPGGADLPYLKMFDAECLATVREVLDAGGSFIGICAGAYFASSECIFEKNDPLLRVVGPRPLNLFPHPATGAVRENFRYGSESGTTFETLECEWHKRTFKAQVYCNGGPAWDVDSSEETCVIARYSGPVLKRHGIPAKAPVAALKHSFGRSGSVVLCGVHPELPVISETDKCDPQEDESGRLPFLQCLLEAASIVRT